MTRIGKMLDAELDEIAKESYRQITGHHKEPHPAHCSQECPCRCPDCEDNCFQYKFSMWLAVHYPALSVTYHIDICENAADIAAEVYKPHIRDTRSRPAPQPDALIDSILLAYMEDVITSVKIMHDESSIVKRDANKTREKVYHDGSLMAYERMIGYLERKKELRQQHGGDQR